MVNHSLNKFNAIKNPPQALTTALNAIVHHTYDSSVIQSTRCRWMALESFTRAIGKPSDIRKTPSASTIFAKKPSYSASGEASASTKRAQIKLLSANITARERLIKVTFFGEECARKLENEQCNHDKLSKLLAELYSLPNIGIGYASDPELADVRKNFAAEHRDAVAKMLEGDKTSGSRAIRTVLNPAAANNYRFKLQEWLHCITETAEHLHQDTGTKEEVLIDAIVDPSNPFQKAMGDYPLDAVDILCALKSGNFGATEQNRSSLVRKAVDTAQGVQLLAAVNPAQSAHISALCDAEKCFQKEVRAVRNIAHQMSGLCLDSTVQLRFKNLASKRDARRWKLEVLPALLLKLSNTPGTDSFSGLRNIWTESLKLNLDPHSLSVKRTDRGDWHDHEEQKRLLSHLNWLWLVWTVCMQKDGTADDFCACVFDSSYGIALARVFLAWNSCATKRIKHEFLQKGFKLPPGWCTHGNSNKTKLNKMLSGPPLVRSLEAIWAMAEVHLAKTRIPSKSFAHIENEGEYDDAALFQDEALARIFQEIGCWLLFVKLGIRPHVSQEISFVTPAEWEGLDSKHWASNQLRYGLFIEYDFRGTATVQDIRLHYLDSKVSGASKKRKYDRTHGAKDQNVNIEIARNGTFTDPTDKQLFTRLVESYKHLFPTTRFYTGDIMIGGKFAEIPVYVFSRLGMPEFDQYFAVLDQTGARNSYKVVRDSAFKKANVKKATKTTKSFKDICYGRVPEGAVQPTRYPPAKVRHDQSAYTGAVQSRSNIASRVFLADLISQFERDSNVELRTVRVPNGTKKGKTQYESFSWRLHQRGREASVKIKTSCTFKLQCTLDELLGHKRLMGGTFTHADIDTLLVLATGFRNDELTCDVAWAGRKASQSYYISAKDLLECMGVMSMKMNGTERCLVHHLLDQKIQAIRQREAHAGEWSRDEIGHDHYHMNPASFPLCEVGRGTLQHAQKRLAHHDIVFSYADGVKKWAEGLVQPAEGIDGDVWDRCGDTRLLTRHEQIQQIDYFTRWKTLLMVLAEHDAVLRGDATMAPAYTFIAEVLGYDPRFTDRKPAKKEDIVMAEAVATAEAVPC